ncbi:hypothetical protein N4P33_02340 [Streptomyces sp. 15-116A]|uniref:hypothetical protein n=1 Tax=Streptomyces sp. 15-116A TaxID=2259035 RepID=UPI0021B23E77|nr:hypothetical protein [Streptomyces sp. 15-116A]MCT7351019.1 hypothetical protein [Streptomyces sp. 15-116A]
MTRGYDFVPEDERDRLLRYLAAVVAARPAPVHTTVAFNAVYFGYDLGGDGYGSSPLRLDDFPEITFGECVPALPVGAMVCIATGSDPLYAEIVYREGAHPELGALGDVPAWVSGAPVGAVGPGRPGDGTARRRELLVPDLHAFGPALSLSPAQLHRLRTRRRWINEDGHVVVDVCYPSREASRSDDLTAYADHLLTTAREQLLSPFVPVSLAELVGSTRDDDLRAGLLGLLDTVRGVLLAGDELRMWGHYAMTRASLSECWRDTGPLGGDDLRCLAAAVERAANPAKRRYGLTSPVTAYTAVGPRLRAFPGAAERLRGVGYAAAVCRANVTLADVVQRDSEQGLFGNGSRVTLDDAFEGGGVWRTHHPGETEPAGNPLIPAGRGWASTTGETSDADAMPEAEPASEQMLEPVDLPLADDALLGPAELLRPDAESIAWRAPLRLAHLRHGRLPLHPDAAAALHRSHGRRCSVHLELSHHGAVLAASEAVQAVTAELDDTAGHLAGVAWPESFFPGLMLEVSWPRGGLVIRVATTRLQEPVRDGDRLIGHCFDPRVLTREGAPGSDRHGDTAAGLGPRQLVMRTVRRCGLLTLDGHALMDRSVLSRAVYGHRPAAAQTAALETAVVELLAEGLLEPALGSLDIWGRPHFPARTGERAIPLIGYRPAWPRVISPWGGTDPGGGALRGIQFVPGHLRRLRPGCSPSHAQRVAFREYCRRLGKADGWELPEGYTFVTEHTRGR